MWKRSALAAAVISAICGIGAQPAASADEPVAAPVVPAPVDPSAPVTPSPGPSVPADPVPGVDPVAAVRIMPLGDSITYGTGSSTRDGYRRALGQHLADGGVAVDFVGSTATGTAVDNDHEGHPGWRIRDLQAKISPWLTAGRPDVVLLDIGTNDIWRKDRAAQAPARLSALLDTILRSSPDVRVVVARIGVAGGRNRAVLAAGQVKFNQAVPGVVAGKGARVTLADMARVPWVNTTDGVHPNDLGYRQMAYQWYQALRPVLPGGQGWPAVADPFPVPGIRLAQHPGSTAYRAQTTVTGRLTGALTGVDLAGVSVQLRHRRTDVPAAEWTVLQTARTGSGGVVTFRPRLTATGELSLRVASGRAVGRLSGSAPVTVTAALSTFQVRRSGATRTISGTVAAAAAVSLRLERQHSGGWTALDRLTVTGAWRFVVPAGRSRYRVVVEPGEASARAVWRSVLA